MLCDMSWHVYFQGIRKSNHGRLLLPHKLCVEDDRLETGVRFASNDLDAIDRQEVLLGSYFGIVPILLTAWTSPRLSLHSRNYDIFIGWCPYSPCTTRIHKRGMRWRSWLRNCATSPKVAGSIPNGVTGIFHGFNPSGRTMALGSNQLLTEMSTTGISWW
jgi:hypothetical protein